MRIILLLSTQPLVGRLGLALVHFLWQGALIASLYLIAQTLFVRPKSAGIRYTLSCAALAAMTVAPVVTLITNPAPKPAPAEEFIPGVFTARPVAGPQSGSIPFESLPTTAPATQAGDAMTWLVVVWLICSMLLSIRLIGGCIVAARIGSLRVSAAPPEWRNALDSLIARARVSFPVRLVVSGFVQTPAVVGWLKPAILLPAAAITGIAPEHIEALLAHELAHIRRHDYLVKVLQRVAETFLFYHPAVWWLSRQIDAEREACCDDMAIGLTGDTLTYVSALASLESRRREDLAPLLSGKRWLFTTPYRPPCQSIPGSVL
jgi:beta-lactamase regulating signal transducer with metallopeptidase domain